MGSYLRGYRPWSVEAKVAFSAAPTELGRASGIFVTINMALLTELFASPTPSCRSVEDACDVSRTLAALGLSH